MVVRVMEAGVVVIVLVTFVANVVTIELVHWSTVISRRRLLILVAGHFRLL